MNSFIIPLVQLRNVLAREAVRCAPDGDVTTGYAVLNTKKVLFQKTPTSEVYIIPWLTSELIINVEVTVDGRKHFFENVQADIEITPEDL